MSQPDYAVILTNKGRKCLVDIIDYQRCSEFRWFVASGGGRPCTQMRINGKQIIAQMSHFIIGQAIPPMVVDHINGSTFDNRSGNLRVCSPSGNSRNGRLRRNSTSGHLGVNYNARRRCFVAHITVNYKTVYLGGYGSLDDAVAARHAAEMKYFGDFAPSVCRKATA